MGRPQTCVSDLGFFTMPQLVLSAGIGGSAPAEVLCSKDECPPGPDGSFEVPDSVRQKAVHKFLNG